VLTFASVALLALGTATGWWPQEEVGGGGGNVVTVELTNGQRVCGSLQQASSGNLSVSVNGNPLVVPLDNVSAVTPADSC
jgi:hypothetical protein